MNYVIILIWYYVMNHVIMLIQYYVMLVFNRIM